MDWRYEDVANSLAMTRFLPDYYLKSLADFVSSSKKAGQDASAEDKSLVDGLMNLIIQIRANARQNKDWATSDLVRDALKELGVKLEDRPDKTTTWEKA